MALTSGIDMKKSQAHGIVTSHAKHTTEYHLASYWFSIPIIDSLKAEDPQGTYIIETKTVHEIEVFQRLYVAPSHSKKNFEPSLKMRIQDGTHVTSAYFLGIFLVCVAVDANRQVKLLAFARVGSETKDNWVWFENLLQKDFPGCQFMHADYAKGVECDEFKMMLENAGIKYGRCFRHMLKNCNTAASKANAPPIKMTKGK